MCFTFSLIYKFTWTYNSHCMYDVLHTHSHVATWGMSWPVVKITGNSVLYMQVSLLKALSSGCHHQNAVMNTLKQKSLPKLPTYFIVEGRESAQVAEDGHSYHGGMQAAQAKAVTTTCMYLLKCTIIKLLFGCCVLLQLVITYQGRMKISYTRLTKGLVTH